MDQSALPYLFCVRKTVIDYIRYAVWAEATAVAVVVAVSAYRDVDFVAFWHSCVALVRSIPGRVKGWRQK